MEDRIIITYCLVDDFCKFCEESQKKFLSAPEVRIRKPTRVPKITHSEIITILLIYQRSHYKDFRNFYGYFRTAYQHYTEMGNKNGFVRNVESIKVQLIGG